MGTVVLPTRCSDAAGEVRGNRPTRSFDLAVVGCRAAFVGLKSRREPLQQGELAERYRSQYQRRAETVGSQLRDGRDRPGEFCRMPRRRHLQAVRNRRMPSMAGLTRTGTKPLRNRPTCNGDAWIGEVRYRTAATAVFDAIARTFEARFSSLPKLASNAGKIRTVSVDGNAAMLIPSRTVLTTRELLADGKKSRRLELPTY